MTKDEINKAIGEACGWTTFITTGVRVERWQDPRGNPNNLPNYHDSLDAMHEAEKWLDNRHTIWIEHLFQIRGGKEHNTLLDLFLRSTAAQRAEAFLRALGKWEGGGV